MKELSIEQKARRYDEAIQRARQFMETPYLENSDDVVGFIFPELKESEDERIRKVIYGWICTQPSQFFDNGFSKEEMLAWLEKQGEQNPADKVEPKFKVGDWIVEPREGEPNGLWHIDRIEDGSYWSDKCGCTIEYADKNFHLWTIQDAKDGDVLYTSSTASNEVFIFKGLTIEGYIECYCSYDSEDKYCEGKYHFIGKPTFKTHPATKEQRDLLFKKMKEAGYEWDAKKKELNKIEQASAWSDDFEEEMDRYIEENFYGSADNGFFSNRTKRELEVEDVVRIGCHFAAWQKEQSNKELSDKSKQEWSEADENHVKSILSTIECCKAQFPNAQAVVEAYNADIEWLNSLRPKNIWKPSDEQIEALHDTIIYVKDSMFPSKNVLKKLYGQLKKLREE